MGVRGGAAEAAVHGRASAGAGGRRDWGGSSGGGMDPEPGGGGTRAGWGRGGAADSVRRGRDAGGRIFGESSLCHGAHGSPDRQDRREHGGQAGRGQRVRGGAVLHPNAEDGGERGAVSDDERRPG